MITVIQRVSQAKVTVDHEDIGAIGKGVLALLAVEKNDTVKQADRLLERLLNYRIFADAGDKMNLSLRDIHGGLLIVPQFTLAADTEKGNRPSFTTAASPELGRALFAYVQQRAAILYPGVQFGKFGADMQVALINDGPVTFTLRCQPAMSGETK
ncbi:MAG: D-aminoacyl-tRNA deacylase [Methylomonas sp.]|jgi:D-tyrosyl-tRNA(Tyr) deacylase